MPKIARNNKPAPEAAAAIEAFGRAADERPGEKPAAAPRATTGGPASALIRWKGNEDLRDALTAYSARERYSVQTLLIEAVREYVERHDTTWKNTR